MKMGEMIDACVMGLNSIGRGFCTYAAAMFFQTGMLVAILFLLDLLLRRYVRATLRYWIWLLVFVKLLLPPSLCAPTGIGYWCGKYAPSSPSVAPQPAETAVPAPVRTEPAVRIETPESPPRAAYAAPAIVEAVESAFPHGERLSWQGGVFVLWAAGVFVFGVLLIQRLLFVRGLIAQGEPAGDDLVDVLGRCRRRVGVRREVGLLLSPNAFSPAVCGFFRPVILMPARLLEKLPAHSVEAILIHELAHLKRGDIWVNCAQTVLQIIYFYNPLVWLANAMVRRVREQAVDEMVLVALGAEAKSYGRTLIDIAEMAFVRVSPALRLVGIAESRKSLEGRIKHMIAKPIPKDAKVGVMGVLVIAGIGAILLPMAQAQRQNTPAVATQETPGQTIGTLPDGTTVELVGLCQDPAAQGQPWWRPDGTPMEEPEYDRQLIRHGGWEYPGIGFLLKFSTSEDLSYKVPASIGDLQAGTLGGSGALRGQGVAYYGRHEPHTISLPDQTDIEIVVAVGEWKVSEQGRMGASIFPQPTYPDTTPLPDGGVILLSGLRPSPREESIKTLIEGTTNPGNLEVRLECTTTDGRRLQTQRTLGRPFNRQLQQYTFGFDVPIKEIDSIAVKYRPFHPVVFRNVSLRAGHKSVVTVDVGAPGEGTPRADGALSRSDNAPERKAYSHTCLANLGKAVLLYANDHDDQLPAGIENTREYLNREEAEWLLANVVYLGKDLSAADYPGRAVAYDRTLLAEGKGTNVLYLDSHVDFENSRELERLGISSVRWDAALRTYEVNRRVADFPRAEDFSTPEAAYATINRIDRDDPSVWQKVSVTALAERFAREGGPRQTTGDPEWTEVLNYARIIEVMVWDNTRAAVMAQLPQGQSSQTIVAPIDVRYLERENGRWLNTGNNRFWTVEEAKAEFLARLAGAKQKVVE